jgi:hypothetical protein
VYILSEIRRLCGTLTKTGCPSGCFFYITLHFSISDWCVKIYVALWFNFYANNATCCGGEGACWRFGQIFFDLINEYSENSEIFLTQNFWCFKFFLIKNLTFKNI